MLKFEYLYVVKRAGMTIIVQYVYPGDTILHSMSVKRQGGTVSFENYDRGPDRSLCKMITWCHEDMLKQDILFIDMPAEDRPEYHPFSGSLEEPSADKYRAIRITDKVVTVKNFDREVVNTFTYDRWVSTSSGV